LEQLYHRDPNNVLAVYREISSQEYADFSKIWWTSGSLTNFPSPAVAKSGFGKILEDFCCTMENHNIPSPLHHVKRRFLKIKKVV
jgi:hypothetical protein